jgi:hypothetical protein
VVQQGKELGHWEGKDAQLVGLDAPAGGQYVYVLLQNKEIPTNRLHMRHAVAGCKQ